jgi:hypothetical protein
LGPILSVTAFLSKTGVISNGYVPIVEAWSVDGATISSYARALANVYVSTFSTTKLSFARVLVHIQAVHVIARFFPDT